MGPSDIEICNNCGREILRLEKAFVFEGKIVCSRCDSKLRSGLESTPRTLSGKREDVLVESSPSKAQRTLIWTVIILAGLAVGFLLWYVVSSYPSWRPFDFKIIDITGKSASLEFEVAIRPAWIWWIGERKKDYVLIYAVNSRDDIATVANEVVDKLKEKEWERIDSVTRRPGQSHQIIGNHGQERLVYTLRLLSAKYVTDRASIHGITFLHKPPEKLVELPLTSSASEFDVTGPVVVKVQIWSCYRDQWEADSKALEKEIPK